MVADSGRIDKKSIVDGPAIIAAPEDFVFVGPFGKLLVVELLFEFGLEIGDFLFLGSSLINELLGSGSGSG